MREDTTTPISTSENRDWYASRLDGIGAHASKLQNERFDIAVSYLETHCRTAGSEGQDVVDRERVLQQLNSIDFHKPVTLQVVEPGDKLVQHSLRDQSDKEIQHSIGDKPRTTFELNRKEQYGEHFTDSGVPTQRLGMTDRDQARCCTVEKEMVVLQSHTRGTVDVWSENRPIRIPADHTENGTTIVNCERKSESKALKPTNDPKLARSVFSRSGTIEDSPKSQQTLQHRSGGYGAGGGVQYHIPKREDCPKLCRHQNLTPVKSQKRGSISR